MDRGYKGSLEKSVAQNLTEQKIKFKYETVKIEWEECKYHTYTPDFILPNGIIIETKGWLRIGERQKHICIKEQHPELDIRFVFTNSKTKIYTGAKSSYGDWCTKKGFMYSDEIVPTDWLKEKKKKLTIKKFIPYKGKKR